MTLAGAELDGRHSYVPEWVTPALVVVVMRRGVAVMLFHQDRICEADAHLYIVNLLQELF